MLLTALKHVLSGKQRGTGNKGVQVNVIFMTFINFSIRHRLSDIKLNFKINKLLKV